MYYVVYLIIIFYGSFLYNAFAWVEIAFCMGCKSIMNKAILGSARH